MSGTTSVPSVSFTDKGFVAPAESAIVTGLDADWNAAFGGDLNTAESTPGGQLITSEAAIIGDSNDQQVALFNGVDPAYASGRMQDAIARIYFLERNPAQSTVLQIECGGDVNVIIPVGALIQDTASNLYLCTERGIIGPAGSVTLSFAAQTTGPLPVPTNVTIYQVIPLWDTAAVVSGVIGNLVESRAAFEARREASVAANGAGFLPAVAGAVATLPGVLDYYVTENYTNAPLTVGGVTLAANSLYVAVVGGAAAQIAQAIWSKKNPGCSYNGNTTYNVFDTNSGYSEPYPGPYPVTWETPADIAISFQATIKNSSAVPSNALQLIQAAILLAFLGEDGGTRARIGSELFASRYYAGIIGLGAWAQIITLMIGSDAAPAATFTGAISGNTLTVSGAVTGAITIGQFVYGVGVMGGSLITAGSGSSWTLSTTQTIAAVSMTTVAPNQNDVTMNINQEPTMAADATGTYALDVALVLM